jgi:hypothetical protein
MSRRTTRRPGRRPRDQHPSIWFFVALGVGILMVIFVYSRVAMKPAPRPATTTSSQPKSKS